MMEGKGKKKGEGRANYWRYVVEWGREEYSVLNVNIFFSSEIYNKHDNYMYITPLHAIITTISLYQPFHRCHSADLKDLLSRYTGKFGVPRKVCRDRYYVDIYIDTYLSK